MVQDDGRTGKKRTACSCIAAEGAAAAVAVGPPTIYDHQMAGDALKHDSFSLLYFFSFSLLFCSIHIVARQRGETLFC